MLSVLVRNRKAFHDYQILDRFEAGLVLMGSEVKSLRDHRASLLEAYIVESGGELYLHGAHISEYPPARHFGHSPLRPRKLLLRKKQINKILGQITKKGMTAIPLKIYSNEKNKLKLEMALALGMKKYDKRAALREKEFQRTKQQVLKEQNR